MSCKHSLVRSITLCRNILSCITKLWKQNQFPLHVYSMPVEVSYIVPKNLLDQQLRCAFYTLMT